MAKQCSVCLKSYSDYLDACPYCAQAQSQAEARDIDESSVNLAQIFSDEVRDDSLPDRPAETLGGRRAVKTMMSMPLDDEAVDLGHGKSKEEKAPSQRPKTLHVTPDEMDAVARGETNDEAAIVDSASAVNLGADASSVNLGSSEHLASKDKLQGGRISNLNEEAPTVDHLPEMDFPRAADAEEEDLPVVEHAAEDDEETAPVKKAKAGSRMWVAGAAGMAVGTAATFILAILNLLPFVSSGGSDAPAPRPAPPPAMAPAPIASAAPTVAPEQYLAYGDFAKAVEGFGAQETQDVAVLVKRGQARWLAYLQEKKAANAPLKKDDEAVAQAVKDLTEAKNAEGSLWLGIIEESVSGPAAARKIYQEGAGKFKQPAEQRLFQSALDRLDATADAPAARQGSRLLVPTDAALALAGLMVALQAPTTPEAKQEPAAPAGAAPQAPAPAEAPAAPPSKPIEEAGADFWKAVKLSKEHKYDEANAALAKAKATHDQQRFGRLYKAQNPNTDPTEMIFLRAADELAEYWRIRQSLSQGGYLAQGKQTSPVEALKAALAAAKEGAGPNKAVAALAELLKKDKDVVAADPDVKDVAKAVETLAAGKQKSQAQVAALRAALGGDQQDLAVAVKKLLEDKKSASDALAEANQSHKALQAKLLTAQEAARAGAAATEKKLVATEEKLARASKELDALKYSRATQSRTQGAQQMMEIWLPLLAQDRLPVSRNLCDTAQRDARIVADDMSTSPAARGSALFVEGLALRGLGKYSEAVTALRAALAADKSPARLGDWKFQAQQVIRALSDPLAYYVPEARGAVAHGQVDRALALVDDGLAVFAKGTPEHGVLLAERSAVKLAQAQGSVNPADPRVVQAGEDAKAAIASKAVAAGWYALGRWHEALGQLAQARQAYEQAVEAHPALDVAGGRYRVALAQLLVRQYGPKVVLQSTPRSQALPGAVWSPLSLFIGLTTMAQDEEQEIKTAPELDRAVQLANEAIQAGNADGYLIKALALAAKQRWTDAVVEYSRGLEKKGGTNAEQGRILRYLIENHPALRIPDGQRPPDVQQAERYFDLGLQLYWERRYAQAEKAFAQAIRSFDQDARFVYYLGLAQLGQDRRDQALESFKKAGVLEQLGKPQSAIVSASLERIQGGERSVLNRYRP